MGRFVRRNVLDYRKPGVRNVHGGGALVVMNVNLWLLKRVASVKRFVTGNGEFLGMLNAIGGGVKDARSVRNFLMMSNASRFSPSVLDNAKK
mmetsp:Transcript_16012/g.19923  ORF Transcript_16012/g.19923 Transcript_16012/m.19923 type:complete len:92 (+) Transcript_16012:1299-1574(+)